MGLIVPVPDALCLTLASYVEGQTIRDVFLLASIFHIITGMVIGGIFGTVVSMVHSISVDSLPRSLVIGVVAGALVWVGFFMPSMLTILSSMVSSKLIAASFFAHIVFGIGLGSIFWVGKESSKRLQRSKN